MKTKNGHDPKWDALNVRTLREASREVLGFAPKKRTLKSAYAEVFEHLRSKELELKFKCQTCDSLIDDEMERCWACGLLFRDDVDAEEEAVVDSELVARAKRLGVEVGDQVEVDRDDLLARIEAEETRRRREVRDADLLTIESARLNEQLSGAMPDGWRKKRLKQYVTYFDASGSRRIAVYHRGLRVQFSVDDGFLDGFAELQFYTKEERQAKHCGRVNYEYLGDTAKYALDLAKRVFEKYVD
jgi:hypothetical protein